MKEEEDGAGPLARAHRKDRRNTKAVVVAHVDNTPSNDDEGGGEGGGDDTKNWEEEVNIDELLTDLKKDILRVYKNTKGKDMSDFHGK